MWLQSGHSCALSLSGHCHYQVAESKLSVLCDACQNNVTSIIIYCRALNDLVLGSLAWILIVRLIGNSMDVVKDSPLLHYITFLCRGKSCNQGYR